MTEKTTETPAEPTKPTETPPAETPPTEPPKEDSPPKEEGQDKDVLDTGDGEGDPPKDVLGGDDEGEGAVEELTFEVPDELKALVDDDRVKSFLELAKGLKLTQDQVDGLRDYEIKRTKEASEAALAQWEATIVGWRKAAQTDKVFGGEDYETNVRVANAALKKFGDEELRKLITSPSAANPEGLGIANHPAFLRFMKRIGDAIGDPDIEMGGGSGGGKPTDQDRLNKFFPTMAPKK